MTDLVELHLMTRHDIHQLTGHFYDNDGLRANETCSLWGEEKRSSNLQGRVQPSIIIVILQSPDGETWE